MRHAAALLVLFSPVFLLAADTEPPPQPAAIPLKSERPDEQLTNQSDLPPGALLQIGTTRSPRMLMGQFSFSPDSKRFAAATQSRLVRVWDVATGKVVHTFGPFDPAPNMWMSVSKVVFAPHGEALAVAAGSKVHLFDLKSGKELGKWEGHKREIADVAFSRDGTKMITGGYDNTVIAWDYAAFKPTRTFTGFNDPVCAVALSDDGKTAAAADFKGNVELWRTSDGTSLYKLAGQLNSMVYTLQFVDGGKTLLACSEKEGVIEWDISGDKATVKRSIADIKGVATLSSDNTHIATVNAASAPIIVSDLKSAKSIATIKNAPGVNVDALAMAPDKRLLASKGSDGILRFWKLPSGDEFNRPAGHQAQVTGVAFSRDGKQVISASEDRTVRFWDASTGKELRRLVATNEHFHALQLTSDGKTVAVMGGLPSVWQGFLGAMKQSSELRFIDADSGKEIRSFHLPGDAGNALRFTADARQLLAIGWANAYLIDPTTGKSRSLGLNAQNGIPAADISPDGRYVAMSTNIPALRQIGKMAYIDTDTTKEAFSQQFYLGGYCGMAFSPDGKRLAVASSGYRGKDGKATTVQLWEVPREKVALNFETKAAKYQELVFSRDGRMLAGINQNNIEVFEVATGKLRHVFYRHEGGVGGLAFSRDGKRLVSGGIDGCILVWDLLGIPKQKAVKLEPKDLDLLWGDLASDNAVTASAAIGKLAARPSESVPYLRERMPLLSDADYKRMQALVADLDSDQFRVRDQAAKELAKLGEAAAASLKQALKGSAEVRQTAERLLAKIAEGGDPIASKDVRRDLRAIEALERIGTAEAMSLLKELRQRGGRLIYHREADAALKRAE